MRKASPQVIALTAINDLLDETNALPQTEVADLLDTVESLHESLLYVKSLVKEAFANLEN